jgi:serine/threonine protein kinase
MLAGEAPALPPMYTPGFASPEHHADRSKLGPWSDIYSVGATLYACLVAQAPPPSEERMEKDRFVSARRAGAGKFTPALLDTVDWCLRLDHLERPQSVFALQKALTGEKPPEFRGGTPVLEQLKGALARFARR